MNEKEKRETLQEIQDDIEKIRDGLQEVGENCIKLHGFHDGYLYLDVNDERFRVRAERAVEHIDIRWEKDWG